MLLRHVIGAVLRRIRRDRGRTLESVARSASMSMQYLSELERGLKDPSSEVLRSVCDALGVRLEDVLDEAGEMLRTTTPVRARPLPLPRSSAVAVRARVERPVGPGRGLRGPVCRAGGPARHTGTGRPRTSRARATTRSTMPYAWACSAVNHRSRSASARIVATS